MKVLITGASGMLGTDLSNIFAPHAKTAGMDLQIKSHVKIPCHLGDMTNADWVHRIIQEEKPDWVFHTAAMTQVDMCETESEKAFRANVLATQNVSDACQEVGSFLIFFSTDYVFDGTKQEEYLETDLPAPLSVYGKTKLAAENYIAAHHSSYAIFRIAWLYGLYGSSFARSIFKAAQTQKELKVVNDQKGRPTYTIDIAHALCHLIMKTPDRLRASKNQIFHLTNSDSTTWFDYARFILHKAGLSSVKVHPVSTQEFGRKAPRPANGVLSIKKAENLLGLKLRPWQNATDEFLDQLMESEL